MHHCMSRPIHNLSRPAPFSSFIFLKNYLSSLARWRSEFVGNIYVRQKRNNDMYIIWVPERSAQGVVVREAFVNALTGGRLPPMVLLLLYFLAHFNNSFWWMCRECKAIFFLTSTSFACVWSHKFYILRALTVTCGIYFYFVLYLLYNSKRKRSR